MKDELLIYPKGSIMVFTKGCYSDFRTCGFLVATQECNLPKLAQEMADGKEMYEDDEADPVHFAAWLISKGYAMPVDHSEIHLGEYSSWRPEFGVTLKDD